MKTYLSIFLLIICSFISKAQVSDSLSISNDMDHSKELDQPEIIEEVFIADLAPRFPGGLDSLRSFVNQNINWNQNPQTIAGKVYVEFVVNEDGSTSNVKVLKGLHPANDSVAIELIRKVLNFNPFKGVNDLPDKTKMFIGIEFDHK